VAHAFGLCLQVADVVTPLPGEVLHTVLDVNAMVHEALALEWVVRHEPDRVDADAVQHLGGDAVGPGVCWEPKRKVGVKRVVALVLQVVGLHLGEQADASSFLPKVDDRSNARLLDGLHREAQLRATIALQASKGIAGEAFGVNPNKRCVRSRQVAHSEEGMFCSVLRVNKGPDREGPKLRGEVGRRWDGRLVFWRERKHHQATWMFFCI